MVPTNLFPPAASVGYAIGQQYGPEMLAAGKKLTSWGRKRLRAKRKRSAKRRRKDDRKNIGEEPGEDTAKTRVIAQSNVSGQSTRTLYFDDCTDIPASSSNAIDSRQRHILNYRGFKVCQEWKNKSSFPLLCNVAVIALKGDADQPTLTTDFFRSYGVDRNLDFSASLLDSTDFHCKPINTDKFTVLKHMRFKLGSSAGNVSEGFKDESNWCMKEFYVPINRQLRYRADGTCHTPFFLVHWCDEFQTVNGTLAQPVVDFSQNVTAYFKEPQPVYAKFS